MSYEYLDVTNCIATVLNTGTGTITNMGCLDTAKPGETISVDIEYINNSYSSEIFALIFCAATEPYTECNIHEYSSIAFILEPGEQGTIHRQFSMPDVPVSYIAELQRWDEVQNKWVSDHSVSCVINIPDQPEPQPEDTVNTKQSNIIPYIGILASLGLGLIIATRK